jgi:hypothetical protein
MTGSTRHHPFCLIAILEHPRMIADQGRKDNNTNYSFNDNQNHKLFVMAGSTRHLPICSIAILEHLRIIAAQGRKDA